MDICGFSTRNALRRRKESPIREFQYSINTEGKQQKKAERAKRESGEKRVVSGFFPVLRQVQAAEHNCFSRKEAEKALHKPLFRI